MAKKIHFMGILGAGISSVAAFAKNSGFEVSGCDNDQYSPFLPQLKKLGIEVFQGHSPSHLSEVETLVISPAIETLNPNNSELQKAKGLGLKVQISEKFLAENILKGKKVIAITGTHGKSTTTAMVAEVLIKAGLDPSCQIGALVSDWKTNYRVGEGEYFVLEADEYQEKFLLYQPEIAVITAVEMDHPEYFENKKAVEKAFEKFANKVSKSLILGKNVELAIQNSQVEVLKLGKDFETRKLNLRLIGDFNQENAALAAEVGKILGLEKEIVKTALESFNGIARRFEFKGEEKGVKVFDDYAHHPTAIAVTLKAAREKFSQERIWLIYQPHMYSRTKHLLKDFAEVFRRADVFEVVLTDIYAARQVNSKDVSSRDIVELAKKENIKYIGSLEKVKDYLLARLSTGDVVIVMGAGDVYKLSEELLEALRA